MVYRKGELSKSAIDRGWPHQVALPERHCIGHRYVTIRLYCETLTLCPRGHSFFRDGADFHVFCFAERQHAERFQQRFGGELMHATERPRWPAG